MSRMAVWKELLGGTRFGSADQPEHWAWTNRRWLMDSDALSSKALGWDQRDFGLAEIHCKAMGSRMRSRLGSKALAREALTRKAQTFAQTFVHEKVSEYGRRL